MGAQVFPEESWFPSHRRSHKIGYWAVKIHTHTHTIVKREEIRNKPKGCFIFLLLLFMFHSVLGKCWSSRERAIFFSPSFIFKTCVCIHTLTSARHTRMAHKGVALEPFFFPSPLPSSFLSLFILLWFIFTTHIAQVNRWHLMHHCSNLLGSFAFSLSLFSERKKKSFRAFYIYTHTIPSLYFLSSPALVVVVGKQKT